MLIAQITDCHIVEPDELLNGRVDTAAMLRAAVSHLEAFEPRPDLVLATGDLVNDGTPEQYRNLVEILDGLTIPVVALPGNHDDRTGFREAFGLSPADPDEPIDFVVDTGELVIVAMDTTIPGRHDGCVDTSQIAWLDAQLTELAPAPVLLVQHHPPFQTGIVWMDASGLDGSEREAEVLARHPHVTGVLCGHIHRVVHARVGGVPASAWPSTGAQVALALDGTPYGYIDEPPAVALHQWSAETDLVSHVNYVDGPEPWVPPWATEQD